MDEDLQAQLLQQQRLITQLLEMQQMQVARNDNPTQNAITIHQPVVPAPSEFSFQAEGWEDWKASFSRYKRTSLASCSSEQQVDYLVGHLGSRAEPILKSFHLTEEDSKNYEVVLKRFDSYFGQKRNLVYERVKFLQRVQNPEEPCDNFITDLTSMAQTCKWDTMESEMIKLRVIAGLADSKLSIQLQSRPDDSLDEVVRRVRLSENLRKQQAVVRGSVPASSSRPGVLSDNQASVEVNSVHWGPKPRRKYGMKKPENEQNGIEQKEIKCRKCGLSPKHKFSECPARNDRCKRCDKVGHWAMQCFSKKSDHRHNKVASVSTGRRNEVLNDEGDVFFLEFVESGSSKPWKTTLKLNGLPITFKIDTGADVTVVKAEIWRSLKAVQLLRSPRPLLSASGDKIRVLGVFEGQLAWKDERHDTMVYVVEDLHENLLGRGAVESLKMLSWVDEVSIPEQYPSLFQGVGNLGREYHIALKPNAKPFSISAPRRVPLQLKEAVKKHLETLEASDIIFKVTQPTPWCAPMVVVPKPNGKIRTCVDYTVLNRSVISERLVLPEVTESLAQIDPEATYFSKLDATSGFYHVPLDRKSQLVTTFITPFGRYAFKKLPMGITSAPERFQREMAEMLEGLEGIINVADDTLVHGRTKEEHDRRLHKVLNRFQERGLKMNIDKCIFGVKKLTFLGHVVSSQGVEIDPGKLEAILKMSPPKDVSGVRRLLGCIQVHARFLASMTDTAKPLNELLCKNIEFVWNDSHQQAFDAIKQALTTAPILALFAPGRQTRVSADASSYGLGAVLEQTQRNGSWRPICYASRVMSDCERRYAQIEREALAATWACEKFKMYLLGRPFILRTDHKPLVELLGTKPLADLTARIQRFRMRLMQFSYNVEYIPGCKMGVADMLSRSPMESSDNGTDILFAEEVEVFVKLIEDSLQISDARLRQIREAQQKDSQTCRLRQYAQEGWPKVSSLPEEDKIFAKVRGEILIISDLVAKGTQIYIPPILRKEVLERIHEGHLGVVKCRNRARETVWWPGIGSEIANRVKQCQQCIEHRTSPVETLRSSEVPDYPWQVIGGDLFEVKGQPHLVIVDYFSRFIEVATLTSSTAQEVIKKLKSVMARWGIPETFRSDNGPCFNSFLFRKFAKEYGFIHVTSSPHFPQSNGQAEAAVKIAKKIITKSEDPNLGLLSYRSTKLDCGYSPAELIMGRSPRGTLPLCKDYLTPKWPYLIDFRRKRVEELKRQSEDFNRHHRARDLSPLEVNDRVWITDLKDYGTIVNSGPEPRSFVVVARNSAFRRNRANLIKTNISVSPEEDFEIDSEFGIEKCSHESRTGRKEKTDSKSLNSDVPITTKQNNHGDEETPLLDNNYQHNRSETQNHYVTRSGRVIRPPRRF